MPVDHWMMFGTFKEKDFFSYPSPNTYKGILINGNMAAYAPGGMAAFLMEKTAGVDYIIDPQTHAFQHAPQFVHNNKEELKSSFSKLCSQYGEPVLSKAGISPVQPSDFDDVKKRKFVENVILFQKNALSSLMVEAESNKYLDLTQEQLHPYSLIAPYFYLNEININDWKELSKDFVKIAREFSEDKKLFAMVVISQGILTNKELLYEISNEFGTLDCDGFLVWVDDLDEHTASMSELDGLLQLCNGLKGDNGKEVINIRGSYFSVLAAGNGGDGFLDGVGHGPEFGEHRAVVPVGGGLPIARYYIPRLHTRIRYRDALGYFQGLNYLKDSQTFHDKVCNCQECRQVINGNIDNFYLFGDYNFKSFNRGGALVRMEYPTRETSVRCLKHYLNKKAKEYYFASEYSKEELLNSLEHKYNEYVPVASQDNVSHLIKWKKVLEVK